ncbi:cytochrome P450 [Streptomyces sp. NA02950]|uniref:cytochrome P450 n=1 Tax=Streptomyces sp. NA02950 TaxID=2742137 RepID=UPI001591A220|nr:cytochrome P450 [Streptomyces sp. NA02950]QKV97697.1 cytochrome P450 [Streptomyces sp. NA02950]
MPTPTARFQDDPDELYRQLRRDHGPVAPILLDGDVPAWLVLGYRELHRVTSDPKVFARDSRRWHAWDRIPADWPLMTFVGYRPTMLFTEGAEHQRRSEAMFDALSSVDQFELRSGCERVADELIDTFAGSGRADLVADYAGRLPLRVVTRLFGLDASQSAALLRDMLDLANGSEDQAAAYQRMYDRMAALVAKVRVNPVPSIPERLAAHPAGLTDEEIVNDLIGTVYASHQPTADWIGNALRLMLTDERFAVTMAGGRRSVGQALNEVLWEDTPVPNFIGRWAAEDTTLGGQHIRKGDCLVLGMAAANADPNVRPDFRAGASGNQAHMSFSHGEHGCPEPGRELAEVIATAAIEVLIDRLPDVTLAVAPEELQWNSSALMHGVAAMPVTFTPAPLG